MPRDTPLTYPVLINVLGVVYVHRQTSDGGDLYLTNFGMPLAELLAVENWYEPEWFQRHREPLEGTSAVYRVPTKEVDGRRLNLVVKNSRVGEDVPLETRTLMEVMQAEFNSPWEEFALVMELREGKHGARDVAIRTQQPLAIYVPPEKMQIWQSGRSRQKINRIKARYAGIDLDILRQYKLVYRWIDGCDVVRLLEDAGLAREALNEALRPLTQKAIADMACKGFFVADMKPAHIIIGENEVAALSAAAAERTALVAAEARVAQLSALLAARNYSVVDYELLQRTPDYQALVSTARRSTYLEDQRDRFAPTALPAHLQQSELLGVPFIYGHAESTGGRLWVVGRNARLFDYFLPERWRKTPCWKLSETDDAYYTFTKDHVHIVWKTSRVGETPNVDPEEEVGRAIVAHGYNSPFEEFAIAHALSENGVPTVYMRAIYMTGSTRAHQATDISRYHSHREVHTPDGSEVLRDTHDYIMLRGYYQGPDSGTLARHARLCRRLDLFEALAAGIVDVSCYRRLFDVTVARLRNVGYDGTLLTSRDILISIYPNGEIVNDKEGLPEMRICNFELIRNV